MHRGKQLDDQSLRNVLAILRVFKLSQQNGTTYDAIEKWFGAPISEIKMLKIACYIMEQASLARTVIANSQLPDEAKEGVIATISSVESAFTITQLRGQWSNHVRDVTAAISNLVILLGALGIALETTVPDEASDLVSEIEELISQFDDPEIDPAVRELAKRHLEVLATLLRHIPIFGLEPALTTYFELMMKIRRTDAKSTDAAHAKAKPLFERMKGWNKVLQGIDKAVNAGTRLLENVDKAQDLLSFIPD